MKRVTSVVFGGFLAWCAATASVASSTANVDVCFVLDTTGSMSGMIHSAKTKIWYIANQIASAKSQQADVRFCLVAFRDRGDAYVTQYTPLTDDLDSIYSTLMQLRAAGGGDTPESVNQALYEAVTRPHWRSSKNTLKIIYLVGDAPPHTDYQDDVPYLESARIAAKRGIFINTIQAGVDTNTRYAWQEIARFGQGHYSAIAQDAQTTTIATPYDQDLQHLNRDLGQTIIPYGSEDIRGAVMNKQSASESMAAPSMSDRLSYNAKTGRSVQGGGDLLDEMKSKRVNRESVRKDQLPAALQSMPKPELDKYVATQSAKRAKIQGKINELVKKRDIYIASKSKNIGSEFDQEIVRSLKTQAAKVGIKY